MSFLLSNDDGVHAPGLRALEEAFLTVGPCWVVAPAEEQSAQSHGISLRKPIRVRQESERRWSVAGTPADAIYIGVHHVMPVRPTLVLSGVNEGANVSYDTYYSGTVAAVREAAMFGLAGLSISLFTDWRRMAHTTATSNAVGEPNPAGGPPRVSTPRHWETAVHWALEVARGLRENPLPEGVFLNLNVPDLPVGDVLGLKVVRLGRRTWQPRVIERLDPWGQSYCWIGGEHEGFGRIPESDGPTLMDGWATLTPLKLDTTAEDLVGTVRRWAEPPESGYVEPKPTTEPKS
jgi:5'-nucleotidase